MKILRHPPLVLLLDTSDNFNFPIPIKEIIERIRKISKKNKGETEKNKNF